MNSGLVGALGAAPLRLTGMTKRVIISSPNADVNALQLLATGGSKNVDLVLTPKGIGALIAGPAPDGTITGGNKRGGKAIDLQTTRGAATQVASGANATILGGANNIASSDYASVGGGYNNNASSFVSTIGGGYGNINSGSISVIAGGYENIINGCTQSTIGGGIRNEIVSATYASILGGAHAKADRYGMQSYAAGRFAANGDAQNVLFVYRNKTTTNTAVELFLDGSSTRLTIPSGKAMHATIHIIGIKSDGTATATYIRQAAIKNVAGTTSLVGDVTTIGSDTAAGTSISITADDTNDALKIDVIGITSETWRWVATVDGVEVAYGI